MPSGLIESKSACDDRGSAFRVQGDGSCARYFTLPKEVYVGVQGVKERVLCSFSVRISSLLMLLQPDCVIALLLACLIVCFAAFSGWGAFG
jgi:hypothetical protein